MAQLLVNLQQRSRRGLNLAARLCPHGVFFTEGCPRVDKGALDSLSPTLTQLYHHRRSLHSYPPLQVTMISVNAFQSLLILVCIVPLRSECQMFVVNAGTHIVLPRFVPVVRALLSAPCGCLPSSLFLVYSEVSTDALGGMAID